MNLLGSTNVLVPSRGKYERKQKETDISHHPWNTSPDCCCGRDLLSNQLEPLFGGAIRFAY